MELDDLIKRGEALKSESYSSPKYGIWKNDVKAAVAPHGDSMMRVLSDALSGGAVIQAGQAQQAHIRRIDRVIVLLNELKSRDADHSRAQDAIINQKRDEARASVQAKFGGTINATNVTFGDNSPISQVTAGEFMSALVKEAEEKLPEGEDKNKILAGLKAAVTNPTFASVTGATVGAVLKKLIGG